MGWFSKYKKSEKQIDEDWEDTKREVKEVGRKAYDTTEEGIENYSQRGAQYAGGMFEGKSEKIRSGTISLFKAVMPDRKKKHGERKAKLAARSKSKWADQW